MQVDWLSLIKAVLGVIDEVLDAYLEDKATATPSPATPPVTQAAVTPLTYKPNEYSNAAVSNDTPQRDGTPDSFQSGTTSIGPMVNRSAV